MKSRSLLARAARKLDLIPFLCVCSSDDDYTAVARAREKRVCAAIGIGSVTFDDRFAGQIGMRAAADLESGQRQFEAGSFCEELK